MDESTVKAIIDTIQRPVVIDYDSEHKIALVPPGTTAVDLSKFLPPPPRVRQRVELLTVPSFIAYILRYAKTDETTVFADEPTGNYDAVIDYHDATDDGKERRPLEHTAIYTCPQSEQWKTWLGQSGRTMDQTAFAIFLENNLRDITDPPGADFLALAMNLQVHKAATFESEIRLDNGQVKFRYNEEIKGSAKAGDIAIPTTFKIAIPVFVDGARYALEARFRYRVNDGKLGCGFELIRSQDVYNAAVKNVTKEITEGLGSKLSDQDEGEGKYIPVYVGKRR